MPNIKIELAEGRTLEQKRQLIEEITEVVARVGKTKQELVRIVIEDLPAENVARGGVLKFDKDKARKD